ncbi:hypothetical protein Bca101_097890 [Brassica carinata]
MDISLADARLGSLSGCHLDRSLAVTRLALLRSLDSLSCGHSTRSLALLVMDSSLAVTWLGSLSHSHSDCSQVSSMT